MKINQAVEFETSEPCDFLKSVAPSHQKHKHTKQDNNIQVEYI